MPQGLPVLLFRRWSVGSAVIHRKKNDLILKNVATCLCDSVWQNEITSEQVVNIFKVPRVSPNSYVVGGVTFPAGERSAVIHCEENDVMHKGVATCVCHRL